MIRSSNFMCLPTVTITTPLLIGTNMCHPGCGDAGEGCTLRRCSSVAGRDALSKSSLPCTRRMHPGEPCGGRPDACRGACRGISPRAPCLVPPVLSLAAQGLPTRESMLNVKALDVGAQNVPVLRALLDGWGWRRVAQRQSAAITWQGSGVRLPPAPTSLPAPAACPTFLSLSPALSPTLSSLAPMACPGRLSRSSR
jgi:hypothetical protein